LGNLILDITPQTHVRATQSDKVFFRIPREQLRPAGLSRLMRLERYNQYKVDLLALAKCNHFTLPTQGLCVKFFIPVPESWANWKKELMHMKLHQSKPDIDNLLKAVFDSMMYEDKGIGHIGEISKWWVNKERGWIEFSVKEPVCDEMIIPKSKKDLKKLGLLR